MAGGLNFLKSSSSIIPVIAEDIIQDVFLKIHNKIDSIHQEMPQGSKRMLGCQLWLNLPAKDKMTTPTYFDIKKEMITVVEEDNATVRIIAGTYKGEQGVYQNRHIKTTYLDVHLPPNCSWTHTEVINSETLFIYLLDGTIAVNDDLSDFENKACAILFTSSDKNRSINDEIILLSGKEGARFVLAAAQPLQEAVAWGGPIVMNTKEELDKAFEELDSGSFIKHNR